MGVGVGVRAKRVSQHLLFLNLLREFGSTAESLSVDGAPIFFLLYSTLLHFVLLCISKARVG